MDEIDYKKLLDKYIEHINYHEGTIYVSDIKIEDSNVIFTDDEVKYLQSKD